MKILVTGATGFLGQQLLLMLLHENYNVITLVRDANKIEQNIKEKFLTSTLTIVALNEEGWKLRIKELQPEIVIHLAAFLTSADDEIAISHLLSANIEFGCQLLHSLKDVKVKYFINTGTFAEYRDNNSAEPNPAYLYAATKTAFRSILSYYQSITGFKVINVIPYTIYGKSDTQKKLIDHIYGSIKAPTPIKMSPGEQVLDFIHINDVIEFYKKLMTSLKKFENNYTELPLGTGLGITPKKIAAIIEQITGSTTNIQWGGLSYRPRDTMYSVADLSMTSQILDWHPQIEIYEGIKNYIQQHRNNI